MSRSSSRRLLVTAAAATSVALLASACGKSSAQPGAAPVAGTSAPAAAPATHSSPASAPSSATPAAPAAPQYAAGTPLISDGSATVTVGGAPVRFPTTVSEASWSPDGSRIAFIDGSGNVATARPDGSSVVVLVKPDQGSKLSGPSWQGGTVLYTELTAAGTHFVRQAKIVGQRDHKSSELYLMGQGGVHDVADTSNPTSTETRTVYGVSSTLVFQASSAKGSDLWIHRQDAYARGGANPAGQLLPGSWPALGPNGALAFAGSGGGIEVVSPDALAKARGVTQQATPVQATTVEATAAGATHLTWTPDGKAIAYSTPTGIMEVPAQPGAAATQLSAKPGVVSFLPAATDRVVTLAGTSPTDLVGASISVSRHRWLTQNGTTPQPAGGGPHGPDAMSVTIVAADDPATAQKELGWAGLYGPTLLSTGHDTLDPRLTAEIKRVLGTADFRYPFPGVATVYLVGADGAFPAAADAAITGLGYKVVHVTSPEKPNPAHPSTAPLPTVAIVDPADTAALTEAKAEGAHVIQLSGGQITAADLSYLKGLDTDFQAAPPQIVAFGDHAFAAASALTSLRLPTPTEALGATHADFLAASVEPLTASVAVAPDNSPADVLLAELSMPQYDQQQFGRSVVTVDPAQGISPTLKALLDTQSANLDEVAVVDLAGKLPADVVKQLGALISGPLGAQAVTNQTADDMAKAEGVAGRDGA